MISVTGTRTSGWTKSISHHEMNRAKPLLVDIYRGIESFQGFLGGAKWNPSIHSRSCKEV